VLVAGIGNIFLADDGFGVEVVRRLRSEPREEGVEIVDFGIRGIHLAYELSGESYDAAILVDAVPRGGPPGTLYAFEPEPQAATSSAAFDAHSLTPDAVLMWLRRTGAAAGRIVVVGCEPETVGEQVGLSGPVAASVEGATRLIRQLIQEMRQPPSCA
jgi:hydrogenase maturation protease